MEKVITMDRFRSGKSLSPLRQAEAYWTALCEGSMVPRRSQIDPRGIENVLHYTFILERIAPGIARFRLAGQHLHALAGMEVRGMPISAFFTAASRIEIGAVLEDVFDGPHIADVTLTAVSTTRTVAQTEARMILLPLRSDSDKIDRAMGVLVADDTLSDQPCRFQITRTAKRAPFGLAPQMSEHTAEPIGFSENQTAMDGSRPHLRLVK